MKHSMANDLSHQTVCMSNWKSLNPCISPMTGCKDSEIGHAKNFKGFKPEPVKPVGDGATSIFHTICGAFSQIVL